MDFEPDDTSTTKSGASATHDHFRVSTHKLSAYPFICSHCSRESQAVQHRCLSCQGVSFCGQCHESASKDHAGHDFERIDTTARVTGLRAIGPTKDVNDAFWCSLPRTGCPSCFGQRPDLIANLPCAWDDPEQARGDWVSPHDLFMSDFEVSSMAGCQLCSLVHRALMEVAWPQDAASTKVELSVAPEQISLRTSVLIYPRREAIIRPRIGSSPAWKSMMPAPYFPPHFESQECFQRLRGWLDECRTKHKHPRCQQSRDTRSDPARLLYVGHGLNDSHLRLVTTDGRQHSYIAFTHCWGTEIFIKTTMANADAFHQNLDKDLLPASFKDAIKCAHAIGVDHVWIDALCIVQDDLSDWQRESAKMCDIYGNAVLVVVADSAANAAAGFLGTRPLEVAGIAIEHDSHEFIVQEPMQHSPGYTASRAWCLQEMVLARRCAIFGLDEMRWECNSLVTCECEDNASPFVVDVNVNYLNADFVGVFYLRAYKNDTDPDYQEQSTGLAVYDWVPQIASRSALVQRPFQSLDSIEDVYNDWRLRVINTFTNMQLTRSTDRLPALSGCASLVGGRLETRYLAGLWLDDLPLCLLWYVRDYEYEDGPKPAPAQYYGPSFSWVSVNGAKYSYLSRTIDGKSRFDSLILSVHDAKCHVPGRNSYGEVTTGELRLTALLKPTVLTKKVEREPKSLEWVKSAGTDEWPEEHAWTDRIECKYSLKAEEDVAHSVINFFFNPDTSLAAGHHPSLTAVRSTKAEHEPFSAPVDLLLVGKTRGLPHHPFAIYAALVLGLSPSRPGAYERLGIMEVRFLNDEPDGREWVEGFQGREILLV